MPAPYEVSPERLQKIFDKRIKKLLFGDIKPVAPGERPTLILLGGQTAAGKSSALNGISERHGDDIAQINPDDFRLFHPELNEIMRDAPHEMTDHTAQAMYAWSDMARAHAHAHGYRLIIENTFSRPEYLAKYAEELSEPVRTTGEDGTTVQVHGGYEVEAVALATPTERGCLDMVGRYLAEPVEEARWSDADYHDSVVAQLPQSLEVVEADPHVDRVIVTDRSGTVHYDNARGPDGHGPKSRRRVRRCVRPVAKGEWPSTRRKLVTGCPSIGSAARPSWSGVNLMPAPRQRCASCMSTPTGWHRSPTRVMPISSQSMNGGRRCKRWCSWPGNGAPPTRTCHITRRSSSTLMP